MQVAGCRVRWKGGRAYRFYPPSKLFSEPFF